MFEAEYLLFCAGKSVDDDGNLSLHSIFDIVYASSLPVSHRPFLMLLRLRALEAVLNKEVKIVIAIMDGDDEVNRLEYVAKHTVERGNAIVPAFDASKFVFPRAATYKVIAKVNSKMVMSRYLRIKTVADMIET